MPKMIEVSDVVAQIIADLKAAIVNRNHSLEVANYYQSLVVEYQNNVERENSLISRLQQELGEQVMSTEVVELPDSPSNIVIGCHVEALSNRNCFGNEIGGLRVGTIGEVLDIV